MKRLARDIALIAFGRAAVAISPYVEGGRPEQGSAVLLGLGWQMEHLVGDIEHWLAIHPDSLGRDRNETAN